MQKIAQKRLLISALALAFGILGLLPASAAHASGPVSLPITSFHQIVADTTNGHLFISQGSSSVNEILVTNLNGQQVATIANQNGVTGIALSPHGNTLYAALGSSHAVTAIDTTTLQQTASYPLGSANTPVDVAVQSGKVWVSYNTATVGQAAIGDIDLSAATPSFHTQANMGGWYAAPQLAADPLDSGVLIAAEPSQSPVSAASYDPTVDPVTVRAQSTLSNNCDNEQDLAVAPGGAEVVFACGWPYAHYRYSTADLSQQGSYASTYYPNAVAIDANGDVAAGTGSNPYQDDLYIYHQDSDTALNTYNLAGSSSDYQYLQPRGLAWAADGSKLFAVLQDTTAGSYSLDVIDGPTLIQSTLTLTGPSIAYITKSLTLTGDLTTNKGTPPAGTPITVTRTVPGGTGTKTFDLTTAADGSFTLTDTPPALGQYIYTANYSGNSTTAPTTAAHTVTVEKIPTSLKVTTGKTTFTYEPTVHVKAHLGTTYTNRTVSIYAQTFGSSTRKLLKTGTVDAYGNLKVSYTAPHSTHFIAVFTGDARYAPKTVTHAIYVRAKVRERLSGYYSYTRIHHRTYWLFHRYKLLHVHVKVRPNKHGQCVTFQVQEYYQGAWRANTTTGCARLNKYSRVTVTFTLSHADIGYHYRIRAKYKRSSTDYTNLNNHSPWRYLIVER